MAIPNGVAIVSINESTRFDAAGRAVRIWLYRYTVGTDGPFTLEVSPADNTPQFVETALQAVADQIAAVRANGA